MKFAIITDIHLGQEKRYKKVPADKDIKNFLNKFVHEINNNIKPDFVVVLGDIIEDHNKNDDEANIDYIVKLLKNLKCPVYYTAGNHDLKNISEEELANLFNKKKLYYSFDSSNYHFIVLFSKELEKSNICIPTEQKEWLKKDLNKTKKKSIVFVHHGLANQDLKGNPWFDGTPENCLISNRDEIRNILLESNKVIAVFNGHAHWDKQNIHDNIPYFTIQSLTDNEEEKGIVSEAYAFVNIEDNNIRVDIEGNHNKKFLHQF